VNWASLQQAAKRLNAVLLSYWVAPNRSLLWVVSGDTFQLIELPGRDRIAALVDVHRGRHRNKPARPIAAGLSRARVPTC
jgi:hypothetical protein